LSVIVSVPARAPAVVGVNVRTIEQPAPPDNELGQLFVCPKSPLAKMPPIVNAAVPEFVTLTVRGALVV
jgi:hypothetical protein